MQARRRTTVFGLRKKNKKKKRMASEVKQRLEAELRGELEYDVPMSKRTTIKVGGPADCIFSPADAEDASTFVQLARELSLAYDILGGGTNLLVKDGGFRGVLIDLSKHFGYLEREGDLRVKVGSGAALPTLVARCREWGLKGCEGLAGIPGTAERSVIQTLTISDHKVSQHLSDGDRLRTTHMDLTL